MFCTVIGTEHDHLWANLRYGRMCVSERVVMVVKFLYVPIIDRFGSVYLISIRILLTNRGMEMNY